MVPEYPFTLPSSGKTLTWKPLPVRVSMQLGTSFPGENQKGQLQAALLGARICAFEGQPRPAGLSYGEIQAWDDELDLQFFAEEVAEKESIRRSILRKKKDGPVDGKDMFRTAVEDANTIANQFSIAIARVLEALEVLRIEYDPLGSGPSST